MSTSCYLGPGVSHLGNSVYLMVATWMQGRIQGGGGRSTLLKTTKVTLFTVILYNFEKRIRNLRQFSHPLFWHSNVVKYSSSPLQ